MVNFECKSCFFDARLQVWWLKRSRGLGAVQMEMEV